MTDYDTVINGNLKVEGQIDALGNLDLDGNAVANASALKGSAGKFEVGGANARVVFNNGFLQVYEQGQYDDTNITTAVAGGDRQGFDITEINNVLYAHHIDYVNEAVRLGLGMSAQRSDGGDGGDGGGDDTPPAVVGRGEMKTVEVHLDSGVHEFNDFIPWLAEGQNIIIRGQGKRNTVLRATNGMGKLVNAYEDDPAQHSRLVFSDLSVDMNDKTGDGRIINVQGNRGDIELDRVEFMNVNISDMTSTSGLITLNGNVENVVINDCGFLFHSFTGRPDYQNKYRVLSAAGEGSIDVLRVSNCDNSGKLGPLGKDRESEGVDYFNGYVAKVNDFAHITSTSFKDWDQYPIRLVGTGDTSIKLSDVTTSESGAADQILLFADGENVNIEVSGFTATGTGISSNDEKIPGDRILTLGGSVGPKSVTVSNCTFNDVLTPLQIREGSNISFSDITMRNVGAPEDQAGPRRAMVFRSLDAWTGHISLNNIQIHTEPDDTRHYSYALRLSNVTGQGYGFEWPVHISDCVFDGFTEAVPINDNESGVVDTEIDNLYARDENGNEPSIMVESETS